MSVNLNHAVPASQRATPDLELRFPPLPRTVVEVSRLLAENTDVPDTPRLVDIVHADPVMAASVLKRINSAFFGVRRHVSEVRKAIYLLGFLEVCNIVLAAALLKLRDIVQSRTQTDMFETIMKSCVGTAAYTQEIATFLNLRGRETAFTAGLLHGAGRLVMLYNWPQQYERLWFKPDGEGMPSTEEEQAAFNMDHLMLGAMAATQWQLPEEVIQIIRCYLLPGHIKDTPLRMLALTVSVSASATDQLCLHPENDQLRFEAKTALRILARSANVNSTDLIALIEQKREPVTNYIHSMVYS